MVRGGRGSPLKIVRTLYDNGNVKKTKPKCPLPENILVQFFTNTNSHSFTFLLKMWTHTQQREVTSSNRFKAWRLVVSQTLAIDQSCGPCNLLVRVKRTPWWHANNKPGGLWVFQHLKLHRENTLANGSSRNFYTSQWEVPQHSEVIEFSKS